MALTMTTMITSDPLRAGCCSKQSWCMSPVRMQSRGRRRTTLSPPEDLYYFTKLVFGCSGLLPSLTPTEPLFELSRGCLWALLSGSNEESPVKT